MHDAQAALHLLMRRRQVGTPSMTSCCSYLRLLICCLRPFRITNPLVHGQEAIHKLMQRREAALPELDFLYALMQGLVFGHFISDPRPI